jgi:outer membrane protein
MKNSFTLLLLFALPFLCAAQLEKGMSTFGGNMGGDRHLKQGQADYGIFVSDHLLLGSGFNALYTGNITFQYLGIGINPYARYYFNPRPKNTFFYVQADYSYNAFLLDGETQISDFGIDIGLDHFLAPGVALSTVIAINHTNYHNGQSSSALNFSVGPNAFINCTASDRPYSTIGQFQKGSLLIGGSSASISRSLNLVQWSLGFSPRVGYFFTNKLVVGAEIGVAFSKTKDIDGLDDLNDQQFRFHPFARYYLHYPKRFNPFVALEVSYASQSYNFIDQTFTSDRTTPKLGLGGNYFLSPNLALEGILDFQYNSGLENLQVVFTAGLQYFIH